jgi:hypothetical protein
VNPEDYSIDDLHQAATAEFEHDADAIRRLNTSYADGRLRYIATLQTIGAERAVGFQGSNE